MMKHKLDSCIYYPNNKQLVDIDNSLKINRTINYNNIHFIIYIFNKYIIFLLKKTFY